MKKVLAFLVALIALVACNSEDIANLQGQGLQVNADFLKLSDNNSSIAGNLVINAGVPEVTLKWITNSNCNLDTTLTTLKLSKGNATLPIKWRGKLENDTYGPENLAFKAGVEISAGEYSKYIPLVWAEQIDSTKILESVQTRAGNDGKPYVAQISMTPTTVKMGEENGGAMSISITDIPYVILDVSEFSADLNIDMSQIPTIITESQVLNFHWKAGGAPKFGFTARVVAMANGLVQIGYVTYSLPTVEVGTLNLVNSNLPTGKVPQQGYIYVFHFEGTYTGSVQVRALINGTVVTTGVAVTNKQPSVGIPENMTTKEANVTFQFKREDDVWAELPPSTNRVQEYEGILLGGYLWAPGNLIKENSVYKFHTAQENYSANWGGGDYFNFNTLDPLNYTISVTGSVWNTANDPCKQVAPAGKWRTPTTNEMQVLINNGGRFGYLNGKYGVYFKVNNELFLPLAGYRYKTTSVTDIGASGLYWTQDPNGGGGSAYCFGLQNGIVHIDPKGHRAIGMSIRCVANKNNNF